MANRSGLAQVLGFLGWLSIIGGVAGTLLGIVLVITDHEVNAFIITGPSGIVVGVWYLAASAALNYLHDIRENTRRSATATAAVAAAGVQASGQIIDRDEERIEAAAAAEAAIERQ